MLRLENDISKAPQIGPRYKNLLNKINIRTVEDLLYHFPFRHEDRSQMKKISDLNVGDKVTVKAQITSVKNIFTKNKKRITKGYAKDDSGEVQLIWFNMHFISRSMRVGETYLIHGRIESFEKKNTFVVPDIEEFGEKNIHLGRIVPIYPTTEGITTKWLRTRISDLLLGNLVQEELVEFLPKKVIDKNTFLPIREAINAIHFPQDFEVLEKARNRLAYEELFIELINANLMEKEWKKDVKAFPMKDTKKDALIKNFMETLPFSLTKDQKKSIDEILKDLEKAWPMNRLLEGDVGTGKTIIAIIAALKALYHGKNVLYMAPTEILAQQHFETFLKFLGNMGVDIRLITGATRRKKADEVENTQTLPELGNVLSEKENDPENIAFPKVQNPYIQIGTHALLYSGQKYENLGLVIIDEQHRFGVEQRAQLLKSTDDKTTPHLLTMTATPIPRTLALTLYGDLDISILREHPNKQREIVTKVIPVNKQEDVYKWIAQQKMSAFVVCPFIEESFAENLENVKAATAEFQRLQTTVLKDVKCALLHGKMASAEKKEIIEKFKSGKVQVLISTPVIEVGIDVPDADVMVIESAERYGLASLHQLRGRVGRGTKKGYCFVFPSMFSRKAYARLKNLEETLDGLKLAEIDLRLRGQGDIYGTLQHGFMDFKLANVNDLDFVRSVREDVNMISEEIENYPDLITYIRRRKGNAVKN